MGLLTCLKNLFSSLEKKVLSEMDSLAIDYDSAKNPLGYALYCMNPKNPGLDEDIHIFLKSFYPFFKKQKQVKEIVSFAQFSFLVWNYLVQAKLNLPEKGEYLSFSWKQDPPEMVRQIKERIYPQTRLESISIDYSDMVLLGTFLKHKGYRILLDDKIMDSCKKGDVGRLIKKYYHSRDV